MPDSYADARAKLAESLRSTRLGRAWAERRMEPRQTRRLILRLVRSARRDFRVATDVFVAGKMSPGSWLRIMTRGVASVHTAAAMAATGSARPGEALRRAIDASVQRQLFYLNRWYRQLKIGATPLDGRAVSRAGLYANAAWGTAQNARRSLAETAGFQWEKRVLGTVIDHCSDCIEYAARGWQPLGTLPSLGDSACGSNCDCHFVFRSDPLPPETAPIQAIPKPTGAGLPASRIPIPGAGLRPASTSSPAPAPASRTGLFRRAATAIAGWVRQILGR